MDLLDVGLILLAVFAGIGGFRLGFFTRVLSWIGMALGFYLAARFLPDIINGMHLPNPGTRLFVATAVLIGAAFVGQAAGMLAGARLHGILPVGPLRTVDKGVGAVVGVLGVFVALWLLLPSISSVAGWPARATRNSAISRWVANNLPDPPNTLETLRRMVASSDFPQVFTTLGPDAINTRPPADDPLSTPVTLRAERSTVKVEGEACNRIQSGSGFAVARGLIATNAHVVAGEPAGATSVMLPNGRQLPATVVLYDPDVDFALLSVPGLDERPLRLAAGHVGQAGAVLGHPGGQVRIAIQPVTIAREITAVGKDLYDTHQTSRDVFIMASRLRPGDSGGPVVDRQGRVVGVAFAIALDSNTTAYALTTKEISGDLAAPRSGRPVSTGACVAG